MIVTGVKILSLLYLMKRRARWLAIQVRQPGQELIEFQLNDRGQLVNRPARACRRRRAYCSEDSVAFPTPLRIARLQEGCPILGNICSESVSPLDDCEGSDETETVNCHPSEASSGPYAERWGDSLFNDGCSFGSDEDDLSLFFPFG
jgi:hypothetical protein